MPHGRDQMSADAATPDSASLTRRDALKVLGAGTAGALGISAASARPVAAGDLALPAARSAYPPAPANPVKLTAREFELQAVRLLESEFTQAQQRDAAYLLYLDADRLLHNFRVNAGLQPKAPVYGGWESQDPWNSIRCHGHTAGHWLTAGSLMYASTGDARFKERVDYMVDELKACQDAGGNGLVTAFPDHATQLENAVRGERIIGVPWYTMHKVYAGLRDAYTLAGNETARAVLLRLADWAWDATQHMTPEAWERMLRTEYGGMNEVMADIHVISGDARFLTLAQHFSQKALLEPLAEGRDTLDGLHANTQIPKVIGFQRVYELTGDRQYHSAARFFWDTVVHNRTYATGNHGDVEHFFPPTEFGRRIDSAKTMETCCAYNMLRLTRMLFASDPRAEYADYYENTLYNSILTSQDPETGWNTYFQPVRPGYLKLYHTPIDSFWCCTGSGLENHAKYGDSIWFQGDDALFVNLFIPSQVVWKAKGLTVQQETAFPDQDTVKLSFSAQRPVRTTVRIRYPAWSEGVTVQVNGTAQQVRATPGNWIDLRREWRTGDVVDIRVPLRMRAVPLPNTPDRVALMYGPILLAGKLGRAGLFPGADILRNERTYGDILQVPVTVPSLRASAADVAQRLRPVSGAPLTFETAGLGDPSDVTLIPYYRLHHERYNLYWQVQGGS